LVELAANGIARLEAGHDHLGVAEDHREQVVEVMRDAAGQAADSLHLLRLPQLLLEALARREIDERGDQTQQLAVARDREESNLDLEARPIGAVERLVVHERAAGAQQRLAQPAGPAGAADLERLAVMEQLVRVAPDQRSLARVAEHRRRGAVGKGERSVAVDAEEPFAGRIEQEAHVLLALAQRLLGLAPRLAHAALFQLALDGVQQARELALDDEVARARAQRLDRALLADGAGDDDE